MNKVLFIMMLVLISSSCSDDNSSTNVIDSEISSILGQWSGPMVYPSTGYQYTFTFEDINFNVFSEVFNGVDYDTIIGSGTYSIDTNPVLNELDLIIDSYLYNGTNLYSNLTSLCIYQIFSSDTLKLSCAEPGTNIRPSILGTESNMQYFILTKDINY